MKTQLKLNVRGWAEQNGYSVEIDRHGVYTNYFLTNNKGVIRIEKDTVKGHKPWIVRANYRICTPKSCELFYSDYSKEYTVSKILRGRYEYANLDDYDIMNIISSNR